MDNSLTQAVADVKAGTAHLLDVRTADEVQFGKAAGADHIDAGDIERGIDPDVPRDAKIYIYCRSGARSEQACQILRGRGFTNVVSVGGLEDWQAAERDYIQ